MQNTHKSPSSAYRLASAALLVVAVLVWSATHGGTQAQEEDDVPVCGDAERMGDEQCDDGNLRNGDGCSSQCAIERCGNTFIDAREQCDDGNTIDNDECSNTCFINFCGDGTVQTMEQCDDRNRLSGDGCSANCRTEGPLDQAPPPPPARPQPPTDVLVQQIIDINIFLASPAGTPYATRLTTDQVEHLEDILDAMRNGVPLTDEQRQWAAEIADILTAIRAEQRQEYSKTLLSFFASRSGKQLLLDLGIDPAMLESEDGLAQIEKRLLGKSVISLSEAKFRLRKFAAFLEVQGIELDATLMAALEAAYELRTAPLERLQAVQAVRDALEEQAVDPAQGITALRDRVGQLRKSMNIIQRDFGEDTANEIERLLADAERLSADGKPQNATAVSAIINRILDTLARTHDVQRANLLAADAEYLHAADSLGPIMESAGLTPPSDPLSQDPLAIAQSIAANAPEEFARIFAEGTADEQRQALIDFFTKNERLKELRTLVRESGDTSMDNEYDTVLHALERIAIVDDPQLDCDDSPVAGLSCVKQFCNNLEQAARDRNLLSKITAYLRDYFGLAQ